MKWLLVGDVHAVASELDDCRSLIGGVLDTIEQAKPDRVLFMGDQFHNHAILHVDVIAFWRDAFTRIAQKLGVGKLFVLVGNHDQPGDGASPNHAMISCDGTGATFVSQPTLYGDILLMPYQPTVEAFERAIESVSSHPGRRFHTVFCHQTFDGSQYENGFFASDGVDPKKYSQYEFISGHIHTPQQFGNVNYIGAPRWRSLDDAKVATRYLYLIETSPDGPSTTLQYYRTEQWCSRLVLVEDREEKPAEVDMKPEWRYIVDIHGSQAFIESRTAMWAGARVRTFKTKEKRVEVSESMGISKALQAFLDGYKPKFGSSREVLQGLMEKRIRL